ncbi:CDP-glycerol glycerophosphotransferase family protein [Anaerofustis stercorihominis]|uniref:CDP-glycerol glycerophosphotransferase family protein n=1 Tax=Anaerofustis stercorihominis TaxID=214853 RepID=UPI00214C96F5|nr:CDP-glycerol glycerophosphotransferase family protein [Anaerofustis stercorihominis]MCR2032998.1 CDP-glycerol glycerophosphotransferase family protein [Anaerofustis stercorihominis]
MNIRELCPAFLFPLLQKLMSIKDIIIYDYYKLTTKVDDKSVFLFSVSRENLSGNLFFIYDKIKNSDFNINICLENDSTGRSKILKNIASSKYTIIDDYTKMIYPLKLRKGTKLIQVWHSTGAFKRMGFSRMGKKGSTIKTSLTHKNYTDVIVSGSGVVRNFAEAFGVTEDKIHPIGVPRTDVFFDKIYKDKITRKLENKYPIIKDKKVILFAPTFRGETRKDAFYPNEYLDIRKLLNKIDDKYIFGIKLHPFIKQSMQIHDDLKNRVIDFSSEREINDLLFITDILITDYSSVIFEYSFFKKNIIYYAPDLKEYIEDRDFFYDYDEYIYGPIARNMDELINCIGSSQIDYDKINSFYDRFLNGCDGHASQRFVDLILNNNK